MNVKLHRRTTNGTIFDADRVQLRGVDLNGEHFAAVRAFDGGFSNPIHAARFSRGANERTKLHQGGVVQSSGTRWKKRGGGGPERAFAGGRINRGLQIEEAGKHPCDIRIDDRHGKIERESGHRVCGVTTHAGKIGGGVRARGQYSAEFLNDLLCRAVQILCARIITEPGPCPSIV